MGDRDLIISQIRQRLEILYQMVEELEREPGPTPPGPGGTTDYNDLTNKPQIEGTTLSGNKTAAQLGLATSSSVSSITSRFEDLITPDNIEVEDNGELPVSINGRLTLHQPIMLNHAIYYCYDESGVDYTYVALDTSGAYPKLSYAQIFKDNKRVHFYNYATDTVPASNSDNFITSGGVYSAIQGLATVARTGSYTDLLNTPTIPDVSNYYTKTETNSEISDAIGELALVARTGDYDDLENKPTLGAAAAKGVDSSPTASSTNLVESGGVATALAGKQESLSTAQLNATNSGITSAKVSQYDKDSAALPDVINNGAKNILEITNYTPGQSYSYRGRTFTFQADGGIKITGADTGTSGNVDCYIVGGWSDTDVKIAIAGKGYSQVLKSSDSTSSNIQICSYNRTTGSTVDQLRTGLNKQTTGEAVDFDITCIFISIAYNINVGENGIVIYPMICKTTAINIDNTFEPYAPTNHGLYDLITGYGQATLGYGEAIPSNADLNNYTINGQYYIGNTTIWRSITNIPNSGESNGRLIVMGLNASTNIRCTQILIANFSNSNTTGAIFIRQLIGTDTWTSWYKFEGTVIT